MPNYGTPVISISFDVDSFRKGLVDSGALTARRFSIAINRAARRLAQNAMSDLESITATWDHKVDFELRYKLAPSKDIEEFVIYNDDLIFKFVDEGTKPHDIPMQNITPEFDENGHIKLRKRLKFTKNSSPKTNRGDFFSSPGYPGDEYVFAQIVHHPGAEPRHFSEDLLDRIVEQMDDVVYEELDAAYERQWGKGASI